MKRAILILALLLIPSIFALNLEIKEIDSTNTIIKGLDQPATFDLSIKNRGASDNLIFYTFFSPNVFPKGTTPIASGETKMIKLEIYPPEKVRNLGYQTFEYFIRSDDDSELTRTLTINAIELEDAFEIGSGDVDLESETIKIYVHNKVNFNFKEVNAEFSSPFFAFSEKFPLGPNQKKEFIVKLNKEDFSKLMAGVYTMDAKVTVGNLKTDLEAPIRFREKNILVETKKDQGVIINTKTIIKTNEGNLVETSQTMVKKNIISRLFTTFSPEPSIVERKGFTVFYTWNQEINPGESSEIKITTNWLMPFIILILIVLVSGVTRYYSNRNLIIRKNVSMVKTKGGEFALKVSIAVKAKSYIERVNVFERFPPLMKLHDKFGVEAPAKIDEKGRKLEWRFERLQEGETRVLNYILYSKVGVVGKFALPRTTALFEREGKILERNSNQAFFMIEQGIKREYN